MLKKLYYTAGEVAEIAGLSRPTIFRAIAQKQIKIATTPGGHARISRPDLEKFLGKHNLSLPPINRGPARILIVDDELPMLRLLQRALSKESNYRIETTPSGFKAGFLVRSFRPDVLVLDVLLKDIHGREVVRMIRSDPELKHIKIVAITGSLDADIIREIKAAGIDGFLQKPFPMSDFKETIKNLLAV